MALVEAEGESLLYTGDFKLKPSRSAERCEPCPAEVLIMETTFGRLAYRFPPAEVVFRDVVAFCRKTLDHGETAVLLAYSMGKSQELLCGLAEAGLPIMLCDSVYKVTRVYESLGQRVPAYERFDPAQARGKVLIFPPSAGRSVLLRDLGRVRVAILTGWAVDSGCRFRHGAEAAFPLSDHADFSGLVEMVRRVAPKKVYTMHGFAAEFAEALRWLGFDAQPLGEPNQLSLPLDLKEFVLAGLERETTPREFR